MNPDPEAARALLAGFVAGAAAAFATTAIALVGLSRSARWRARAGQAGRLPLPLLGVVFANGLMLAWTLLGLVLGAAYLGVDDRHPAVFGLAVVGAVAAVLVGTAFVRGRLTAPMWSTALVAALCFGLLLPLLAG